MKERLIDILEDEGNISYFLNQHGIEEAADHLLRHGVIVLPVKVGDTVFKIASDCTDFIELTVESIHNWSNGVWKISAHTDRKNSHWVGYELNCGDFGKTVFLSREEAEEKVRGLNNG